MNPIFSRELNRNCYQNISKALLANIINSFLLAFVLWSHVSQSLITFWLAGVILICSVRFFFVKQFQRVNEHEKSQPKWQQIAFVGQLAGTVIWATPSVLLFPEENDYIQVFIAFVIGGMAAGSITSMAYSKKAIHIFLAGTLTPLFLQFLTTDTPYAPVMAFMILLGYVMTLFSGLRVHADLIRFIRLGIENEQQKEFLEQSEKQYSTIINQAADAYYLVNKAGEILDANSPALKNIGLTKEQLLTERLKIQNTLVLEGEEPCSNQWANLSQEATLRFSCFQINASGEQFPVDVSAKSINLSGKVLLSIFVRDESERQIQQNKLQQAKGVVDFLLDHTPLGYMSTDDKGRITDWNKSAENIFGYSKAEMLHQYPQNFLLQKAVLPEVEKVWQHIMLTHESAHSTNNNLRKDGKTITCKWFTTPIVNLENNITGMASFVIDVTLAVKSETALKKAKEEAELANQAKTAFLSRMSHELRTPLNAILGYSQLLELDASQFSQAQQLGIQHINTSGQYLLGLINDLLDISTLEAGKIKLETQIIALQEIVAEALAMVSVQASSRAILIDNGVQQSDYQIRADQQRMRQVLMNLLSNAVKYNESGGRIDIFCEDLATGFLRLSIKDTGSGIRETEKALIFSPFERFHEDRSIEGTGIGLTISKMLVELMGGRIGVDSQFGQGSTFWLELPLVSPSSQ